MPKALFFDQDGVIVDTERDGHRVAFNRTFREFGFETEWSVERYHELLQIGGGKERMLHHLRTVGFGKTIPSDKEAETILAMHHRKTDLFIELLESGQLPLRPGIHRLMSSARDAGLTIGICTTSNERSAEAIRRAHLADIPFRFILAGDVVKKKKPDPEIYLMALQKSGLNPTDCVVVEDSSIGCRAAKAAGCHVVATVNVYTRDEDLSQADVIVSSLGEPGNPAELLGSKRPVTFTGVVDLDFLTRCFG